MIEMKVDGLKAMIICAVLIIAASIAGFVVGYDYHGAKVNNAKVNDGKTETYTVINYENGLTTDDGYNMSIHTMQEYVTKDEHCGGLHISDETIE